MPILRTLVLLLLCQLAHAQDIILKTDQTEISATVTEINDSEVKFKYFNRPKGPTYSLKKSLIFVIIYSDGTREKFTAPATTSTTVAASSYRQTQPSRSAEPASVPASAYQPSSTDAEQKRHGWTANVGYSTPLSAFGEAHAITYGGGYYFLGPGRKGGLLLDVDIMNFFGEGSPNYGILAANGLIRPSTSSSFYIGGGVGYATVSVEVATYDRYGIKKTTKVSDGNLGGKAFMGLGLLRLSVVLPSFQNMEGSSLFTIGLHTNPF